MAVDVDATLQVETGTGLAPLQVADDAASPTELALPVLDADARLKLEELRIAIEETLYEELALAVATSPGSHVDSGNVPTAALGSNGEYLGTPKYIEHAGCIIFLYATQAAEAPSVVQVQYSDDPTFATGVGASAVARKDIVAGPFTYAVYLAIINGSYLGTHYRGRVKNGAVAQTLAPIGFATVNKFPFSGTFGPLDANLTFFSQALLVRAVLAVVDEDGNIGNVIGDRDHHIQVSASQITDAGNTVEITSASGYGAVPGNPFIGVPFATQSRNIQENLTTVVAYDGAGFLTTLGGTLTFHYYDEVGGLPVTPARITQPLPIRAFSTVRGTGWLSNAGGFFSVDFEPDRPLVAGETVAVTTLHSKLAGNDFKRLPGQVLEEENQPLTTTQTFLKGFTVDGDSENFRAIGASEQIAPDTAMLATKGIATGFNPDGVPQDIRVQGRHAGNSTNALLPGGGVYRGTWFRWQDSYGGAAVDMKADVSGTFHLDLSEMATMPAADDSEVDDSITEEYDPAADVLFRRHFTLQSEWVRVRYVNDLVAQAEFNLDTAFLVGDTTPLSPINRIPRGRAMGSMGQSMLLSHKQEGYTEDEDDEFVHLPASLGPTGKRGLNTTITGIEAAFKSVPANDGQTSQKTVGTSAPVRLDPVPMPGRVGVILSNMEQTVVTGSNPQVVTLGHGAVYGHDSGLLSSNGADLPAMAGRAFPADETVEIWVIARPGAGGTNTQTLVGGSASGTGTAPTNARVLDGAVASESAVGQIVDVTGFTITPTLTTVQQVLLGIVARKQAGQTQTATIANATAYSGSAGAVGSVSTAAPVPGGTAMCYVAFVGRDGSTHTVLGLAGLGLTWTKLLTENRDDNNSQLDCWIAVGNATTEVVTASFGTLPVNSVIDVIPFTGVDQVTPAQANGGTNGNATIINGPALAGTNKGMSVFCVLNNTRTATAGTGYTERSDHLVGSGATELSQSTETKPLVATGTETAQETLSGGSHFAAIGVTLLPAAASDPVVTLSYELSNVAGATDLDVMLNSTTLFTTLLDITGDRDWDFTDVPNVEVIATALSLDAASIEIDQLFLRVIETSAPTCRVSLHELAIMPE